MSRIDKLVEEWQSRPRGSRSNEPKGLKMKPESVKDLREWWKSQSEERDLRIASLVERLLKQTPSNLEVFINEENCIIPEVIKNGVSTRRVLKNYADLFGFQDLQEFAKRFTVLQKAWSDEIIITITWQNNHCFEVTFTAA